MLVQHAPLSHPHGLPSCIGRLLVRPASTAQLHPTPTPNPTPTALQAILPALLACIGRALNEGDESAAQVGRQ